MDRVLLRASFFCNYPSPSKIEHIQPKVTIRSVFQRIPTLGLLRLQKCEGNRFPEVPYGPCLSIRRISSALLMKLVWQREMKYK